MKKNYFKIKSKNFIFFKNNKKENKINSIYNHYLRNLIFALLIILFIYIGGIFLWDKIKDFFLKIPLLKIIYDLIFFEFNKRSAIGLVLISFFGSLFFLGFPGEIIFLIYANVGYSILFIAFIMIFFIMLAQALNYSVGYLIEKKWLDKYIGSQKKNYHISLKKYDSYFILIFNVLPLPADLLSVFLGIIKYDFKKAMLFTFLGKIIKFIFLILLFYLINNVSL